MLDHVLSRPRPPLYSLSQNQLCFTVLLPPGTEITESRPARGHVLVAPKRKVMRYGFWRGRMYPMGEERASHELRALLSLSCSKHLFKAKGDCLGARLAVQIYSFWSLRKVA
jgi:hypothetical protein